MIHAHALIWTRSHSYIVLDGYIASGYRTFCKFVTTRHVEWQLFVNVAVAISHIPSRASPAIVDFLLDARSWRDHWICWKSLKAEVCSYIAIVNHNAWYIISKLKMLADTMWLCSGFSGLGITMGREFEAPCMHGSRGPSALSVWVAGYDALAHPNLGIEGITFITTFHKPCCIQQ